jgi:acyl carrier protein
MQRRPEQVLEDIRAVLAVLTDIDPALIVPDAQWEDFGADRFDFFGVLKEIQKRYEIEIPDDDAFEMDKVGDLISFVVAHRR